MTAPEFSNIVKVDEIPSKGLRLKLKATEEECLALTARFDLLSLEELSGFFELKPLAGGPMIRAVLSLSAKVEQACVISGAPVAEEIDLDAVLHFAPPSMVEENIELTLADADPPEPIENGEIDLGEICAQQLAVALDPYPRAEGAAFDEVLEDLPEASKKGLDREGPASPFAALAALKKEDAEKT